MSGENLERVLRDLRTVRKNLDTLTEPVLADLIRRSRYRADGEVAKSDGPRSKGSHSDSTLSAVVRVMSGKNSTDPIFEAVRDLCRTISDMADLAQSIDEKRRFVLTTSEKAGVRSQIAQCVACGRDVACTPSDRIRAGYCQACYRDWTRQGKPYRTQFETDRRAKLAAEDDARRTKQHSTD